MNKLLNLTKILLKNTNMTGTHKKQWKSKFLMIFVALCFLPMMFTIYAGSDYVYDLLRPIEQQGALISFAFVGMAVVISFFGIFYVLAAFYYGKDIEQLLYLPFSPYQILGAKLITVIVYELLVTGIIYLPMVLAYGINEGANIVFYVYALLIFFMIPVIPLLIAAIFVMLIMRFTNIGKRKELMSFVGSILVLFVALGFNFFLQNRMSQTSNEELIQLLTQGNNSFINLISNLFYGMKFAATALVQYRSLEALGNFMIFFLILIIGSGIFLFLGEKLYFKGVIGITESSSKREELSDKDWKRHGVMKPAMISLMIRELRLLTRSPIYFMNCILISILMPVIFIGAMVFAPEADQEISMLLDLLKNTDLLPGKLAVIFGIGLFMGSINGIAATGISREGKSAYVMKFLPVSMEKQIFAKIFTGIIIGFIGVVTMGIGIYIIGLEATTVALGVLLSLNGIVFMNMLGMVFDLMKPKLNWDNEQQAVKQNMNSVINMFLGMGAAFGIGFLVISLKIDLIGTIGILLGGFLILNILLYFWLMKKALKKFLAMDM